MKLSRAVDKKLLVNNNLSLDGDSPAASRYTEARLEKLVSTAMLDLLNKPGIVKMVDTYDGKLKEPTVLPVRFPVALTNPVSGIAIGYATNIPSFNLRELNEACIYLLENNDEISEEDFMAIVKGPDFPTGGVISGFTNIKNATLNGEGAFLNRGDYTVEEDKKINRIIFNSIPYGISKLKVVADLKLMDMNNEVPGIRYVEDESTDDVRIVIEVDKTTPINVVLGYIFNKTCMSQNFNTNMTFISEGKPRVMGAIDILKVFNQFRQQTKTYELNYDKERLEARLHIVEGFIKLAGIIDEVIKEIKLSTGKENAKGRIVKKFGFTEVQAESIVNLQLHRLSKTDKKAYNDEKREIKAKLVEINKILKSNKLLRAEIIKELEQISEEFGTPRKTKVVKRVENWNVDEADLVEDETVYVGVSTKGYIKRSSKRSYNSSRSGVGLTNGDTILLEAECSMKDILIIFTSKGRYYRIPNYKVDEFKWGDVGKYLGSVGTMDADEEVVSAYVLPEEDSESRDKYILTVKDDGLVNKATLKNYVVSRHNNSYDNIKLGDAKVIKAFLVGKEGYLGVESSSGKALNFDINEVSPKGVNVVGMRSINLKDGEFLTNAVFDENRENINYVDGKRGQAGQKQRK